MGAHHGGIEHLNEMRHMETTTLKRDATCHRGTVNRHRIAREILDVLRFHSIGGDQMASVVSASDDERILRRAQSRRRLDEYWLQFGRRSTNDVENITSRRLLLQRLAELSRTRLHLLPPQQVRRLAAARPKPSGIASVWEITYRRALRAGSKSCALNGLLPGVFQEFKPVPCSTVCWKFEPF